MSLEALDKDTGIIFAGPDNRGDLLQRFPKGKTIWQQDEKIEIKKAVNVRAVYVCSGDREFYSIYVPTGLFKPDKKIAEISVKGIPASEHDAYLMAEIGKIVDVKRLVVQAI